VLAGLIGCAASPGLRAVEPAQARWGPLYIEPLLEMESAWVDNLYRTENDEVDSWILTTRPSVRGWLQNGPSTYGLLYELEDGRFEGTPSGEDDDYTDHRFRGDVHQEFNDRNLLELFAELDQTHEDRGTGLTEGAFARFTDRPIELDHTSYGAGYTYGSRQTDGKLEFRLTADDLEYQNFREFTRFFDHERWQGRGIFSWNMSPRSALVADLAYGEVEYRRQQPGQPALDSEEWRLLLGATWEATARTSGRFKIGGFDRQFDDEGREDTSGFSWDAGLTYRRRTYSVFDVNARQINRETNGLGDFIESSEFDVNWLHIFSSGYRSNINMLLANDNYSESERDDIRLALEWIVDRPFRRWLDLGVGWRYEDRDSDLDRFSMQRHSLFARLRISL
jgi:hypothetical protein